MYNEHREALCVQFWLASRFLPGDNSYDKRVLNSQSSGLERDLFPDYLFSHLCWTGKQLPLKCLIRKQAYSLFIFICFDDC